MSIEETEQEIIDEFSFFEDWSGKYAHIIDLGKSLNPMPDEEKKEQFLVKGCQAKVWLYPRFENGRIFFDADSDAMITKGIVSLMVRALSGQSPRDILDCKLRFVDEIGLKEHLSPMRSNGLVSMIKQMKMYALALSARSA
ncbi:MAG: SufE family protein [Flavobacteriales bacterium]|nr:SufE family protein [Flavobacteriales bacterium]MCB9446733.1 SufE family protein [Flavobacteriales bacterium]